MKLCVRNDITRNHIGVKIVLGGEFRVMSLTLSPTFWSKLHFFFQFLNFEQRYLKKNSVFQVRTQTLFTLHETNSPPPTQSELISCR